MVKVSFIVIGNYLGLKEFEQNIRQITKETQIADMLEAVADMLKMHPSRISILE